MKVFRKKNIKAIAFYLPQFHRIPENDKWWGEGFTDWQAVKDARAFIDNQKQPRHPKKGYYTLLSSETLKWQADLVQKADIYGLCFYHYWFKEGKQLLEKPAEILLKDKTINMRFCFSWANESWIRTWSNIAGNVWTDKYDARTGTNSQTEKGMLIEQEYGLEEEWRKHFEYLCPFFADERYIKHDGKPVFILYRPNAIPRLAHMVRCWNAWAREKGFKGLYIIGTIHQNLERVNKILDAELLHSPLALMNDCPPEYCNGIKCYSYDKSWRRYLEFARWRISSKKCYFCAVTDHDTTPRKGKNGVVFRGMTPKKLYWYFHELVRISRRKHNDYVFINAWNEWGEAMYLEPDEEYGYACLNAVKKAL